jgi:hypothetical protein
MCRNARLAFQICNDNDAVSIDELLVFVRRRMRIYQIFLVIQVNIFATTPSFPSILLILLILTLF